MANYVEEFVAFLGWEVDDTELEGFNKQIGDLGDMLKKATAVVVGAAGALTALTAVVNQATAANVALAKSVGVSSEFLESMGGIIRPLGFEIDNVVDLVEEMNNKIGESVGLGEPISGVKDATKILGLEFKKLQDLAPEDQFIAILDAAKNLENQQAAVSAVDILMGGEANKILGFLREQDEGLLQLIERQMKLNLLSEQGRAGAERFNNTFGEMKTVIGSAKAEFFGLLGDGLAPLVEKYNEWVMANNGLIKSKIAEWADRLGRAITWVISSLTWFIGKIDSVVTALGGLEHVLKLVSVAMIGAFGAKTILALSTFIKFMRLAGTEALIMNAKAMAIPLAIAAIIALFLLLGEDLYQFFTGGESALGKIGDKVAEFAHSELRPGIANFLGMTPEELDMEFLKVIDSITEFWGSAVEGAEWAIGKIVDEVIPWFIGGFSQLMEYVSSFVGFLVDMFGEMATVMNDVGLNIYNFFAGLIDSFVNFVSALPGQLVAFVKDSVSSIGNILSDIPLIGGLFGDNEAPGGTGALTPTPGARAAGATINNSSQSVSRATQHSSVFNITQAPGESGDDLARRVSNELQRASARAVATNASGIEI